MSKQFERIDADRRLNFLHGTVTVTFVLLTAALVFFQIIMGDSYVRLASQNRLRILRLIPPRGIISDINGAPLAANVRTFNLSAYPIDLQKDENRKTITQLLNRYGIPMDGATLDAAVEKQYSAPYRAITLASNLTLAQVAELVTDKDFKGLLSLHPVWKRTYPAGEFTAHVVGHVGEITKDELDLLRDEGYRGGDITGKNGIEAAYEDRLQGKPGEEVIEVDSRGRKLRDIGYTESSRGRDVRLTIDLTAQRYAAELLGKYRGAIVAVNVNDGSVRCLYSAPSYDPNPLTWGISNEEWAALIDSKERPMMNRAISGAYPPASTFKVVTASSVLENKIVDTGTVIRCPGYFELGNRRFRCWRRAGHGNENVIKAIKDSCDVYFYQAATWLGIDKLIATAAKFGVGTKTGIDITGESAGTLAGPEWKKKRIKERWYGGDTVNYSIGQGYVLMTPLQVACAYAAIANGGRLYTPKLNDAKPAASRGLGITDKTLKILQQGLVEVTGSGTGRLASQFGVPVAGKTGTAQNPHGDDHAWFAGYAPVKEPAYAVVAIVEAGKAGSSVAGPMVGKMLNYLVNGVKYAEPPKAEKPKS